MEIIIVDSEEISEVYYMKNKFKIVVNLILSLSVILIVVLVVDTALDYQNYLQHPEFSAPFSAYLILNSILYGIPIMILLVVYFIFRKKAKSL